ncbi:MAG: radical SAM family heme chaperone HemW [Bacteroidales bacterium]|nr:radical SAM family heme chaperone HemW [Bacteroidales bacterium]
MAGIYLHIPFCASRCGYCDFHSSVNILQTENFVNSLLIEIEKRKHELEKEEISTIYFGGGTPSLLPSKLIKEILEKLSSSFNIDKNAEISLEANPDDLEIEYLNSLLNLGINRLSIGIQSFSDDLLKFMGRRHNSAQAIQSVKNAQSVGFNNISIDFIYALPKLTEQEWKITLQEAIDLNIQHISAYALGIEEGTSFYKKLKNAEFALPSEEKVIKQYEFMHNFLEKAGFVAYEISNFCKPNYKSRHNSSYWEQKSYIGFGPGAHSYNGEIRRWNIANNETYISAIFNNENYFQEENLSKNDKINELIMTNLRTINGLNLETFEKLAGHEQTGKLVSNAQNFIRSNHIFLENNSLILTLKGKMISDYIISKLMI